jgi:hypothetical protein
MIPITRSSQTGPFHTKSLAHDILVMNTIDQKEDGNPSIYPSA